MASPLQKVLRLGEGKRLKEATKLGLAANGFADQMSGLSDAELRGLTDRFRARLADGEELDDVLPEAFAAVREAATRTIGLRHFDVQLIGGAVLHKGWISEMKTGEGKTLVATLPTYLNALTGKGVHVVTVNDYLAKRDAEWMGPIFRFLGMTIGTIQSGFDPRARKPMYDADITYGTNNEFGFDYLRDNMAMRAEDRAQRGHHYAIVDEVDSILIDEARTPLIISGPAEESAKWYKTFSRLVPRLRPEKHYEVDEKKRTVAVTEEGVHEVEKLLGIENLYDQISSPLVHYLQNALRAKELYKKDVDYLVDHGEVKIVDEFTGRVLEGRRYSEGMHQAIEAKENVRIKEENVTLATITIQNYFRLYDKLSGMTGTAVTEAAEFEHTYKVAVVEIPPNRPVVRQDDEDSVYKTEDGKFEAIVQQIQERNERGQPILIGTVSIEKSEKLARLLDKRGITHSVLNAKQHEREAHIVAQAGARGAVTVATNMAGRGVDIVLGGNPEHDIKLDLAAEGFEPETDAYDRELKKRMEAVRGAWQAEHDAVLEAGGLFVIGTERHESRRIDNQLRGRSGRQGDPGESRFFLSLQDDLMRLFATGMVERMMERLKIPEDQPIEAKMVSKAIQRAQGQREAQNFEIRKNVLKYDDVMNKQRAAIYARRNSLLDGDDITELAEGFVTDVATDIVEQHVNPEVEPTDWDIEAMLTMLRTVYPSQLSAGDFDLEEVTVEDVIERVTEEALDLYDKRAEEIGEEEYRDIERRVLLNVLDSKWREHMYEMDYLKEGIGLRAVGQRDPLVEYQREGFAMFQGMQHAIKEDFVQYMFHVQVVREQAPADGAAQKESRLRYLKDRVPAAVGATTTDATGAVAQAQEGPAVVEQARSDKVGRNEPCPCGSGRKYKKCHGLNA